MVNAIMSSDGQKAHAQMRPSLARELGKRAIAEAKKGPATSQTTTKGKGVWASTLWI